MMAQRPMPKINQDQFRAVEELVEMNGIFNRPTPFLHRGQGMMIRMCHRCPLRSRARNIRTR